MMNNRLPALAAAIRSQHLEVTAHHKAAAEKMLAVGAALAEAKTLCAHGAWGAFLKEASISERSAQRYMRLHRAGFIPTIVADFGVAQADQCDSDLRPDTLARLNGTAILRSEGEAVANPWGKVPKYARPRGDRGAAPGISHCRHKLTELGTWDEALLSAELNDLLADDFDLSLVGFSDGELDKLLAYVAEYDGEEGGAGGSVPPVTIPEPPRNPASRTGDLWILGDHRLLCDDSTSAADVRRLMKGERAILFATDPPYLVDYDGSNHPTRNKDWSASYGTTWDDSSQGAELYDGFIAAAVAKAIAEDAAWYCWHASRRQAMLEACWEKAGAFVHQQIIWVKDRGVLTRSHYLWKHEPCFMGWRRPNRPPKVAEQTLPSTWALPSFAKDERPDHPTPKPLDAFGIPMRQHVARGGLCYEPFSGSGSQIMAGEANGRRVFAMEISPTYVDVAVECWQAETGREAILDGDGRSFAEVKVERLSQSAANEEAAE